MTMRTKNSPNFNERAGGVAPTVLILHYTGTKTAQDAEDVYMDANPPKLKSPGPVSPHYMIDYDGTVTQFVAEDKRAWHAGASWWDGRDDINSHSIGIEIVNPGINYGYVDFTQAQMDALAILVRGILSRNPIPAHYVLGHSDIAPTRKPDPGEKLDWAWLAARGIGLWPQPDQRDYDLGDIFLGNAADLHRALTEYGYDPRLKLDELIPAFQRHFQPDAFIDPARRGRSDRELAARLHWLLRMKNTVTAAPAP
ncbi:N-acetylmuramoyl-L-alanine amidase [Micavibrio aeruginosavorus]|uniref:N-acetylmuramoyl-L-alanine amidase n=1 Tax=Micavibrio aeruginosavorus EPB TaxID=349215 RepID=M4VJG3_9BACT|nr:N-acetylmuramoyl-L-alanine amidase [Micavibrio aeruginosavorus]AGH98625.1 N-acetylmuramoyl-L-alanine amidase [Micavibrio aeruginosavorus EPB]